MKGKELLELLQSCSEDELALDVTADNGTRCIMVEELVLATRGKQEREATNPTAKSRFVRLVLTNKATAERTIGYRVSATLTDIRENDILPPSEGG